MAKVRVLNVTRVSLYRAGATSPEPLRLSFLDVVWISLPPIQRVLLYRTDRPLPSITEELRNSLSCTLPRFYSLGGRFTHVPGTRDDVVISFSGDGDDGVDVLEAEADGFDFQRLAEDADHDVETFLSLVPPLDVGELPAPVFSVQVTGLAGGGVAVGLSVHHMVADGKALWQFVEAWAAECRGGAAGGVYGGETNPVLLDRSVIRHPRAEEIARSFLRTLAPGLPKAARKWSKFESSTSHASHSPSMVLPAQSPSGSPSSTPSGLPLPPIQRLFLYRTDRPLPSVAEKLRASLSRTLPRFHSLAGRLTHVPDTGEVVISFSGDGDDGVDVLEAEAEGFEFRLLAEDADHDVEAFSSLVPPLDVGETPAPVFSVQVTGFAGAGVAVGLSVHHTAADGKALWQFVEAWAAECRGCATAESCCGGEAEPVVLDRSVIRHPRAEEIARRFVRTLAPDLPKLSCRAPFPDRRQLARRTFVVSAASIASLRDRGASGGARPSVFVALSAHAWLTFLRAKAVPLDDQNAILGFLADCRRRLDPPIADGYFGNCVRPCLVQAKTRELLGSGGAGFGAACAAIRGVIDECMKEPLSDCERWLEAWMGLSLERMANVAASPRFRVYDQADFGWGRPLRAELVSMNKDGEVSLVAARDEEGGVQATVALSPLYMNGFASLFLDGLQKQT